MIQDLIRLPLTELQTEAFRLRKLHFGNELTFSIPGTVAYQDASLPFHKDRFAAISVTGTHCDLRCGHCEGKLLEPMIPAEDAETLSRTVDRLRSEGALGILLSGGANRNGEVPLEKFITSIRKMKETDSSFRIIVHTGLIKRETAKDLKDAGVDQVLLDMIGDERTIHEIYHLKRRVEDY